MTETHCAAMVFSSNREYSPGEIVTVSFRLPTAAPGEFRWIENQRLLIVREISRVEFLAAIFTATPWMTPEQMRDERKHYYEFSTD